jgi:hypothetical protein
MSLQSKLSKYPRQLFHHIKGPRQQRVRYRNAAAVNPRRMGDLPDIRGIEIKTMDVPYTYSTLEGFDPTQNQYSGYRRFLGMLFISNATPNIIAAPIPTGMTT